MAYESDTINEQHPQRNGPLLGEITTLKSRIEFLIEAEQRLRQVDAQHRQLNGQLREEIAYLHKRIAGLLEHGRNLRQTLRWLADSGPKASVAP